MKQKIICALCAFVFLSACKKKETGDNTHSVVFQTNYGNEGLALNTVYATSAGDSVRFTNMKIYLSEIELLKSDGSSLSVGNIFYFSQQNSLSAETYSIPEGIYSGIRFNFGLTDAQNSNDSTTVACPNPLCVDNGMWWDDSLKYTWIAMDGGVKPSSSNEFNSMLYHIGTSLYRRNVTINQSIQVSKDTYTLCSIVLDVQKIIDGSNPMNMATENISQTTDYPAVAAKFSDNIVNAFSISQ